MELCLCTSCEELVLTGFEEGIKGGPDGVVIGLTEAVFSVGFGAILIACGVFGNDLSAAGFVTCNGLAGVFASGRFGALAPGASDDRAAFIRLPTLEPLRSDREVLFSAVVELSPSDRLFLAANVASLVISRNDAISS